MELQPSPIKVGSRKRDWKLRYARQQELARLRNPSGAPVLCKLCTGLVMNRSRFYARLCQNCIRTKYGEQNKWHNRSKRTTKRLREMAI